MMTCFAGYIDNEGNLTCSNAGQTFPLIVDEKGNIIKVSVIGYPLGSAKRAKFKQETIKLPDKCRIVLYSDGIIEAMNNKNEPFGYDRFEQLVKKYACKISVEDFKEAIEHFGEDEDSSDGEYFDMRELLKSIDEEDMVEAEDEAEEEDSIA